MLSRVLFIFFLVLSLTALGIMPALAQMTSQGVPASDEQEPTSLTGVEKPFEYERQAYGYDPEGIEYKENQPEDFQVVFVSSVPFTALASYGITGLASLAFTGNFGVGGDYFLPFLACTFIGSTTIACVSVLTNKYPAPPPLSVSEAKPHLSNELVRVDLVSARF
jgi:hypothetical protein